MCGLKWTFHLTQFKVLDFKLQHYRTNRCTDKFIGTNCMSLLSSLNKLTTPYHIVFLPLLLPSFPIWCFVINNMACPWTENIKGAWSDFSEWKFWFKWCIITQEILHGFKFQLNRLNCFDDAKKDSDFCNCQYLIV